MLYLHLRRHPLTLPVRRRAAADAQGVRLLSMVCLVFSTVDPDAIGEEKI